MRPIIWIALAGALVAGCQKRADSTDFIARVGDTYFLQSDLDAALNGFPGDLDTLDARTQIVDQWVENELLYQEAIRENIGSQQAVKTQLKEAERAVLIDALISPLFGESVSSLTDADLRTYYDMHKERLRILEPFISMRYLGATTIDSARAVYSRMHRTPENEKGVIFDSLVQRHATDPALSHTLASSYWPESRLFAGQPHVRQQMLALSPPAARVFSDDSLHYYLEMVDRIPVGTVPEFEWVEEQVRTQCAIDLRKQLYNRYVEQLKSKALAREKLTVRR